MPKYVGNMPMDNGFTMKLFAARAMEKGVDAKYVGKKVVEKGK